MSATLNDDLTLREVLKSTGYDAPADKADIPIKDITAGSGSTKLLCYGDTGSSSGAYCKDGAKVGDGAIYIPYQGTAVQATITAISSGAITVAKTGTKIEYTMTRNSASDITL